MNLLGYLVTLANLQSFQRESGPMKDFSVEVGDVRTLAEELKTRPEFPLDQFKKNGYYRSGAVGKYLSDNLRDYIYNGNTPSTDEGVVVTYHFNDNSSKSSDKTEDPGEMLSLFIHRNDDTLNTEDLKKTLEYENEAIHPKAT